MTSKFSPVANEAGNGAVTTLRFNVSFQVKQSKGKVKQILRNVTDSVRGGETLAIMGPSGEIYEAFDSSFIA
jgi:predicted ABC-type transport system involved in lysophospholipase L1 biosynthesis ATPase subunit